MSIRLVATIAVSLVTLIAGNASAQKIVPSPLLTIDQNRTTVVDRIVGDWGDRLAASNAGISSEQLREILSGLRADHLLAASLAGNIEGLRNVVAGALVNTGAPVGLGRVHPMSLGDTGDDLVYTPIVPCRILDTRNGTTPPYNAPLMGGSAFPVAANLPSFAPQGGSATNCTLPGSFAALAVTLTVLNPNFDAFMAASSAGDFATLTQAVVMNFSANKGITNTAIVPVDATVKFYLGLPTQVTTQVIADAVGYFRRPTNYGGTHTITGLYATDSGGFSNTASGEASTVAGGDSNTASGLDSTVAGGNGNIASGNSSTIAGGADNFAGGVLSAVGGGWGNLATADFSTVAGGIFSTASGYGSTVGGGNLNRASGDYSVIAGGDTNTVSGFRSTVAGGAGNSANAAYTTVAGGVSNSANGIYSTVAGGDSNAAGGVRSFAAGFKANAAFNGCFVWADNSNASATNCFGINQFISRALGGFYFYTGGTLDANYSGAALPSGAGAWSVYSDRAGKDNFRQVNAREVLRKVAALPVATWNWKSQNPAVRHMGPTAQDFHAAFGLGETPKAISTVDADGVALAAIQGLHQSMRQQMFAKDKEIAQLKRKLNLIAAKLGLITGD